ncbi:hypothetical protein Bca52824_076851 [Brassica carinata]|uniref:Uncharacterized protein n=1 Tax=Brassica carinata TaxID=52824 RepID=A0A8X7PUN0_BRACI|nr:hypothetical protein Bca52824_076851 [Brassica carinata]
MGIKVSSKIKRLLASSASGNSSPKDGDDVDVREEYANAFRTESYNQFWTRVISLNRKKSTLSPPSSPIESSSTSARLMSYRLFAHNLLEPDPNTVTKILVLSRVGRPTRTLLSDYFLETANAFLLCTLLLKNIHRLRSKYESPKPKFQSETHNSLAFLDQFTELSRWFDPFISSGSRIQPSRFGSNHYVDCYHRLPRLCFVHSRSDLLTGRFKPVGLRNKLTKTAARLDVAAKGTYILSRDLDTISRLVTRINDEVEHVRAMAEFWAGRGSGRVRGGEEVARELKRCEESFSEELDELEEHIYLCFMTINRARNLVVREIMHPDDPPDCSFAPKSK